MNNNIKRSPLLRSNTISKRKVDAIIVQLKNIPSFWKKRFIKDDWQLVLTDKMPQEFGGVLGKFYADANKRQMWLNVGILDIHSNIIYIAFAYYVSMEYAQINESTTFTELVERNKHELNLFLRFRGNTSSTKDVIFAELFSLVIETNGENSISKIDECYQYVKKWVYGQIFDRNLTYIPYYVEVGVDVYDEQIQMTEKVFESLPQRLQQRFLKEGWKIRISNERLLNDSTYGLCSSFDNKIFIRSSSPELTKTILHEFGHYLDSQEHFISRKKSFATIYKNERMAIRSLYNIDGEFQYAISSSEEYFADTFALYMINPHGLQKYAPKSYSAINNVVIEWK